MNDSATIPSLVALPAGTRRTYAEPVHFNSQALLTTLRTAPMLPRKPMVSQWRRTKSGYNAAGILVSLRDVFPVSALVPALSPGSWTWRLKQCRDPVWPVLFKQLYYRDAGRSFFIAIAQVEYV